MVHPPRQARLREEYVNADRAIRLFDEVAGHARPIVREADPVRLSYAAAALDVVDQTVRADVVQRIVANAKRLRRGGVATPPGSRRHSVADPNEAGRASAGRMAMAAEQKRA